MSTYLHDELDSELQPPRPTVGAVYRGTIATAAADMADKVYVLIPGLNPTIRFGPCGWQSRDSTSHPARGDGCLIVFDDHETAWVPMWWPEGFHW